MISSKGNLDQRTKAVLGRIRLARKQRKLTMLDTAIALHLSHSTVASLELGRVRLTMDHIYLFADLYKTSPKWIIFGEDS